MLLFQRSIKMKNNEDIKITSMQNKNRCQKLAGLAVE
jgi:hypothetical protein